MSESTFEATTVEAALEQAATQMDADPGDLEHEVVEEKQDFWGMGGGRVVIRAWRRAEEPAAAGADSGVEETSVAEAESAPGPDDSTPGSDSAAPADETAAEAVPQDETVEQAAAAAAGGGFWADEPVAAPAADDEKPEDQSAAGGEANDTAPEITASSSEDAGRSEGTREQGEVVDPATIVALLEQAFHDMAFDCTVEIEADDEGYLCSVAGPDKDLVLEGNGRCLSALELIANNAFRHKLTKGHKVRVDAGNFRSRREDELADLAFQVAHSAKEAGRTQETQPLNPYERRLVHLALAEDSGVTTRSRGSGFLKNVQIIPRGGGGSQRRR